MTLNQRGLKIAAYRQIKVVVGNGKKLATLISKRNKIVKIRVFIGSFVGAALAAMLFRYKLSTIITSEQAKPEFPEL